MANRNIVYFPNEGKHSPVILLKSLCNNSDISHFLNKLEQLAELDTASWNFSWLEHFKGLYQVKQGNFRLYFQLIRDEIVVSHVCRKVGRTARPQDLERAKLNLKDY
jgi:mRNA-degrading endonuclease RelE of RelBE toxin-antitoxin system